MTCQLSISNSGRLKIKIEVVLMPDKFVDRAKELMLMLVIKLKMATKMLT